ncbi:hypothetical protein C5F52_14335 [Limnohabitans sp. TS-CS-82]|uniref:hypothetical protein n=1 Tax=Limnohabitans sp. TS-CS-82 TaxID=2094193 RepID=UPI000D438BEC|nr:hypothetical protein [Limnohabitans sp. TS-CS-82]PQA82751.1 hypothetical protein C5F52_14335 [Limnohabitans sp. TS-CS-82]
MKRVFCVVVLMCAAITASAVERVFIPLSPTEFSEGFNRAARFYKLKYRLPFWPAKTGKFSAIIAPGITVAVVGIDKGDAIDRITINCKVPDGCEQGIVAAALAVDPNIDMKAFGTYMAQRLQGQMEGQSMQQNGIYYFVDAGKKAGGIEMIIEANDEND